MTFQILKSCPYPAFYRTQRTLQICRNFCVGKTIVVCHFEYADLGRIKLQESLLHLLAMVKSLSTSCCTENERVDSILLKLMFKPSWRPSTERKWLMALFFASVTIQLESCPRVPSNVSDRFHTLRKVSCVKSNLRPNSAWSINTFCIRDASVCLFLQKWH